MKESERARVVAGKYQLEKLLGQGGMGEVWVATDLARGGKIALKLLKVEAAESKEHRARFEREARIATSLVSPHITRVSDSGLDEDGTPFMAMELLSGQDLQQRIKTEKVLPITYVVRLAIQVGRGLHVAHAAGLVHRDLKPANIFLAQMGDEEIAKVLDFGIAKGNAQDASEFTTAGAMLGTASYMSPEQIRNAKTVDHRADLWALAVVLFRSLTGQFPFQETGFELFLAMMQDPLPRSPRWCRVCRGRSTCSSSGRSSARSTSGIRTPPRWSSASAALRASLSPRTCSTRPTPPPPRRPSRDSLRAAL